LCIRPRNKRVPQASPTHAPIALKTILIVEDEAEVRELAALFMKSAGYTVLTARDGVDALASVQSSKKQIDVVVTDVVMPEVPISQSD
jgi:CheY-like chemotaxis protein